MDRCLLVVHCARVQPNPISGSSGIISLIKYWYHISTDISTVWPKSDMHTWIYPWIYYWIYPWISISTARPAGI